jgi:hypothetical protein
MKTLRLLLAIQEFGEVVDGWVATLLASPLFAATIKPMVKDPIKGYACAAISKSQK